MCVVLFCLYGVIVVEGTEALRRTVKVAILFPPLFAPQTKLEWSMQNDVINLGKVGRVFWAHSYKILIIALIFQLFFSF